MTERNQHDSMGWWLCPNSPRCPHAAVLHDIEDFNDPLPMCVFEQCPCGKGAAVVRSPFRGLPPYDVRRIVEA